MDPAAILIPAILLAGGAILTGVRVLFEYERGVVFRLGKLTRAKGPGLVFLVPFGIDRLRKMDLRIVALDIAPQDTITGFLLAGVGDVDFKKRSNFLTVKDSTSVKEIENAFRNFTT